MPTKSVMLILSAAFIVISLPAQSKQEESSPTSKAAEELKAAFVAAQEEATLSGDDVARALSAYDQAVSATRRPLSEYKPTGADDPVLKAYQEMLSKSDQLVERLITPEYEANVPVRDLLSADEKALWRNSKAGLQWSIEGQKLVIEGAPADKPKLTGVLSVDGWTKNWKDLVLDLDFEVVSGEFEVFLRYRPDSSKFFAMTFKEGVGGVQTGRRSQVKVRVKGSTVEIERPGLPKSVDKLNLIVSRTGGIGFAVPAGSKVIIHQAKLKVLRPR